MRVSVQHRLGDLSRDLVRVATTTRPKVAQAVHRNVAQGNAIAQRFARESSGPHGLNYYKRLTAEVIGPLEGEYGPEGNVVENAVGAGWRNGPVNTDLPRSADIQGPKFARDVGAALDGLL